MSDTSTSPTPQKTGFHFRDLQKMFGGSQSTGRQFGILGALVPKQFKAGWRVFYTQQHGDNFTWEILANPSAPGLLSE